MPTNAIGARLRSYSEDSKNLKRTDDNFLANTEKSTESSSEQLDLKHQTMADIRCSAKKLTNEFMGQMEARLTEMMDDVVDSLEKRDPNQSFILSSTILSNDKTKPNKTGKLPEKIFKARESPLTELLKVPHLKTIHHIFIATLTLFMLHGLFVDLLERGTLDLGLENMKWAFGETQLTLLLITGMNMSALLFIYPLFYFWSTYRFQIDKGFRSKFDVTAVFAFAGVLFSFIYIPMSVMLKNPLPPASGAAVTMEQCRLLMKMYAFVRSNVPRATRTLTSGASESEITVMSQTTVSNGAVNTSEIETLRKRNGITSSSTTTTTIIASNETPSKQRLTKSDSWLSWNDAHSPCPDYSKYLYFLFAPTLIYRDSYPRTSKIHWDIVCYNLAQCFGCILYANFLMRRFTLPYFCNFGKAGHEMNLSQIADSIFSMMLPGIIFLVLLFFLLLHAWHNAFAEMMRFGDRMFYKDWWNCSSFAVYYKTWNILVHDWLYTYVFKDAWECGLGKIWKPLPTTLVFLISSVFHEYIISMSFNYFFPVILMLFGGFGFALVFVKNRETSLGNILMWMSLISGTGIIVSTYSMEYFARMNCPPSPTWDYITPRALTCGAIKFSFH